MIRKKLILVLLMLLPNLIFSQQKMEFTTVKSNTGEVRISGIWEQLNKMDDSGQTYLKNSEGVIIAVAKNLKTSYPFVKKKKSAYENVKSFYKWDSDYRKANNFNTSTIKENSELEYIIWKYADDKMDNVFLFGSVKDNFINLLVYTNKWSEVEKVKFLEAIYEINK